MILCGDLGGTKSDLALFPLVPPFEPVATTTFASRDFATAGDILDAFLARRASGVRAVCLGVPGPVLGGRSDATNLPWRIDAAALGQRFGGPVFLLNDLEAYGWGLPLLDHRHFAPIQNGADGAARAVGNAAIIAAGTGLGEAGLYWDGRAHRPFASEGGHTDFAPRSPRDVELLRYLLARYPGHVSYARIVSGPGLVSVFEFLRDVEGYEVTADLASAMQEGDAAGAISRAALAGGPPIAVEALDIFVRFYGAEAGNLALKMKATGGVYLGGGIAPKILPKLLDGTFAMAFADKGRFRKFLAAIPVYVVLETQAALYGTARFALEQLRLV
jgi:glucokinase